MKIFGERQSPLVAENNRVEETAYCMPHKNNPKLRIQYALSTILIILAITYFVSVAYRSYNDYKSIKEYARGWSVPVHKADNRLGWRPIPLKTANHIFPVGPDIPTAFDAHGFRRPLDEYTSVALHRPYILSLGCSFTYGDACLAEDTFVYKVAKSIGGTELNAGVCGIGLAQMVLLAEELIPEYSPEFVLVQYSPWLVDRSTSYFGPTYYTHVPLPYFAESSGGGITIMSPVFIPVDFDMSSWRSSSRGLYDFSKFLWRIGIPLNIYDDFQFSRFYIRYNLGLLEKPLMNKALALDFSYGKIKDICEESNSTMIVVVMGWSSAIVPVPDEIIDINIPIINVHEELLSQLMEQTDAVNDDIYYNAYGHIRGTPPKLLDIHPNPRAHSIVAACIVERLEKLRSDLIR